MPNVPSTPNPSPVAINSGAAVTIAGWRNKIVTIGHPVPGVAVRILDAETLNPLPIGHEASLFQAVFSGPRGIDPYAFAVSDVYQDMFGEGLYSGKGIYDITAFEASRPAWSPTAS